VHRRVVGYRVGEFSAERHSHSVAPTDSEGMSRKAVSWSVRALLEAAEEEVNAGVHVRDRGEKHRGRMVVEEAW
jgi:hypothetical protein